MSIINASYHQVNPTGNAYISASNTWNVAISTSGAERVIVSDTTTTVQGAGSITGTLAVTGAATFASSANVAGAANVAGTLYVGSTLTLGGATANAIGTSPNNLVQLNSTGKLPAVDGSLLTNLPVTGANVQTFNASGTWTKPSGFGASSFVLVQLWGGGGSGGRNTYGAGGGGGGYNQAWFNLSNLGSTETATVGAGGAAVAVNGSGNGGGTSSFGSWISAYGGGGGTAGTGVPTYGGSGGGQLSAGAIGSSTSLPGKPYIVGAVDGTAFYVQGSGGGSITTATGPVDTFWHGAGGGYNVSPSGQIGASSLYGGAGGGSNGANSSGGNSKFGGNGGAGGTNGTAGTQPGGGGGGAGSSGTSGKGGDGRIIVTVFYGP